jgi:hypothetical protein
MPHLGLAPLQWLAFALATTVGLRLARAEPSSAAAATTQPPVAEAAAEPSQVQPAPPARIGIEILVSAGWGTSTGDVRKLSLSPYGTTTGLDVGYSWQSGVRLGGYFAYSLGHTESQFYYPLVGRGFDLIADTSSVNAGLSIGYDVPLYGFLLRYALGVGATVMYWDFGSTEPRLLRYYDSPSTGFHIVPGATLLWPHDWFQGGIGFRYLVQTSTAIPSGFLGELTVGVRL